MAVRIADTLKTLSNTFPVAECIDIDVNIKGKTKRLQKAIDDGEIGGSSTSIDDANVSNKTTYSSEKIENKIEASKPTQDIKYEGEGITCENTLTGRTSDMLVKGNTYQNLITEIFNLKDGNYLDEKGLHLTVNSFDSCAMKTPLVQKDKQYTMAFNFTSPKNNIVYIGGEKANEILQGKRVCVEGYNKFMFVAKNTDAINLIIPIWHDHSEGGFDATISNFMLLEGDWTDKEMPKSITGIESAGEKENKISILSKNNKTADDINYKQDKKEILLPIQDGLKSLPNGTVDTIEQREDGVYLVRRIQKEAYAEGDENNNNYLTDKVNTYKPLETPIETKLDINNLDLEVYKDITYVTTDNAIQPTLSLKVPSNSLDIMQREIKELSDKFKHQKPIEETIQVIETTAVDWEIGTYDCFGEKIENNTRQRLLNTLTDVKANLVMAKEGYEFTIHSMNTTTNERETSPWLTIMVLNRNRYDKFYLVVKKVDGSVITEVNSEAVSIFSYTVTGFTEISTITVAAYDSNDEDKEKADFVCTGSHDEIILQKAIDLIGYVGGGTVKLCDGNYNIDSLYDTGDKSVGKYALYISFPGVQHEVTLEGTSRPIRRLNSNAIIDNCAVINITETAYNSVSDDDIIVGFGTIPSNISNKTYTYPAIHMGVKNIGMNMYSNQKPFIMLNGQYASTMFIDGFLGSIQTSIYTHAVEGVIGLRGCPGMNFGTNYNIRNCFIWGCYFGYDIGGEHLIMQNCGCRMCVYSMRIDGYDNPENMSHPNTIINFADENCSNGPLFNNSGKMHAVSFYDYNAEIRDDEGYPRVHNAVEVEPGKTCGVITYASNYKNYVNSPTIPFWDPGHGLMFRTTNMAQKSVGTTAERITYAGNYGQTFFDTTLNKMVMYDGTKWVDMNGAVVD